MSNDIRKILELPDQQQPQVFIREPPKTKQHQYKQLPRHPFLKLKQHFSASVSPVNDQVLAAYPEYSNLQADELRREQLAIKTVLQPMSPIPVSEVLYYLYCFEQPRYPTYVEFCKMVDEVFRQQLHFLKAADVLKVDLFELFRQFLRYCTMLQDNLDKMHAKDAFEATRVLQATNYYLSQINETKIQELQLKHNGELSQICTELLELKLVGDIIVNSSLSIQQEAKQRTAYQIQLEKGMNKVFEPVAAVSDHKQLYYFADSAFKQPKAQKQTQTKKDQDRQYAVGDAEYDE